MLIILICILSSSDSIICELRGLNPPPDRTISITFHVLLPIHVWDWSDRSQIRLVFGNKDLGGWTIPVGNFGAPVRYVIT